MWQKVAKFKGAEYFRKALYLIKSYYPSAQLAMKSDCVCMFR